MFVFVCYALLCAHSSFAFILKRKQVALLLLSYRCIVTINIMWLFLMGWSAVCDCGISLSYSLFYYVTQKHRKYYIVIISKYFLFIHFITIFLIDS